MALKQHTDVQVRYEQQVANTRNYVIPFIESTQNIGAATSVLEIGTGEGGVLRAFAEKGCTCVGVDLNCTRIELAKRFLTDNPVAGKMEFLCQNVYDENFLNQFKNSFDLIVLKDSIEHIPEQEKFIPYLKSFLKPEGQIYFGFPPWYMPFGGHQQICESNFLSKLPYYHILPMPVYKWILKLFKEHEGIIKELEEIKQTRITIERFERILKKNDFTIVNQQHYFINPIYLYKFGLKARKQIKLIIAIPYLRDFFTTCVYYTVK